MRGRAGARGGRGSSFKAFMRSGARVRVLDGKRQVCGAARWGGNSRLGLVEEVWRDQCRKQGVGVGAGR